jgi:2-methylisocitrate lyase-like PEP mutase family enzyme
MPNTFKDLHATERPLVLPNAWDVASARVIEDAGARAIATSSAGVAWSLGAPDGDRLDRERAVDLVARVVAAVRLPVSADIESGFGETADDVAETVAIVREAGAVGVNIEDAHHGGPQPLRETKRQAERLAAARQAGGDGLFLNARLDTYLLSVGDPADRFRETVERAAAYREAGADGIFVPGVYDAATIGSLAREIDAPLNVTGQPGAPTITEMAGLGVARVSVGARIAQAAYALARRSACELLTAGTYDELTDMLTFAELNRLLSHR